MSTAGLHVPCALRFVENIRVLVTRDQRVHHIFIHDAQRDLTYGICHVSAVQHTYQHSAWAHTALLLSRCAARLRRVRLKRLYAPCATVYGYIPHFKKGDLVWFTAVSKGFERKCAHI